MKVVLRVAFTVNNSVFARVEYQERPRGFPTMFDWAGQRVDGRKFFKIGIHQQPNIMEGKNA